MARYNLHPSILDRLLNRGEGGEDEHSDNDDS